MRLRPGMRFAAAAASTICLGALLALAAVPTAQPAMAQQVNKGPSGLPLPRFVSLGSDKINVRRGPGQNYNIAWVFVRSGLPVEIIREFENWRLVRDWEGSEGWIHRSLLSGHRTAMIAPWDDRAQFALRRSPSQDAAIVAYLQANLVAEVATCAKDWCRLEDERFNGWIEQNRLWGVYPQENLEK